MSYIALRAWGLRPGSSPGRGCPTFGYSILPCVLARFLLRVHAGAKIDRVRVAARAY